MLSASSLLVINEIKKSHCWVAKSVVQKSSRLSSPFVGYRKWWERAREGEEGREGGGMGGREGEGGKGREGEGPGEGNGQGSEGREREGVKEGEEDHGN